MNYDTIIIGAGSAGCVLAGRLSEDKGKNILLIEAGGHDNRLTITMPAALPFAYQNQKLGWGYQSGPEPCLDGRTIDEKRGRVIGGSSSINAMIYNRGNPFDFEGWADKGLSNWDFAHVLPYFRAMETFSGGADEWRGNSDPLNISRCQADHSLHERFLRSGEQVGFAITPDHNGYKQEGLHIAQSYIHQGQRVSAARAYLNPARRRSNLTILCHCLVRKLLIEKDMVIGVEVERHGRREKIFCQEEVILSAGAFNSPQILMLSGIGDAEHLRPLDIALKAHVPEIGKNLENHPGVNVQYSTRHQDSLVSQLGLLGRARLGLEWLFTKKGLGASNFFETGAFLKTNDDVAYPNMQYEFLPLTRRLVGSRLVAIPGFQFWMDLSRPQSRGYVRLCSKDPNVSPSIIFNHLQDTQDIRDLIDGVKLARQMIAQPIWDEVRGEELSPGRDVQTDSDLVRFIRQNLGTSYHPSGTCRMGMDDGAVVDEEGRVKAIQRLRVVDASIMPTTVTANISACVMMMTEKIADHIRGRAPLTPDFVPFYRSS